MEIVATFVKNAGAIWLRDGFYFGYSGHTCNCSFKLLNIGTNLTTMLFVQRKNKVLSIIFNDETGSNAYMRASFKKKNLNAEVSILLLRKLL